MTKRLSHRATMPPDPKPRKGGLPIWALVLLGAFVLIGALWAISLLA